MRSAEEDVEKHRPHMADALIAAACEMGGAETFYTRTVQNVEHYEEPMEIVFLD